MFRGKHAKISTETKQRILDAANSGENFVILAKILNVHRSTAYKIVQRGRPNNLPKDNSNAKKVDNEIIVYAVTELEKNVFWHWRNSIQKSESIFRWKDHLQTRHFLVFWTANALPWNSFGTPQPSETPPKFSRRVAILRNG